MRFVTRLPGLVDYPPNFQEWERDLPVDALCRMASVTEQAGFTGIAIPEQLVVAEADAATMGRRWPDPLTTMAFLAGITTRLRLISTVIVLPLHELFGLAKAMATLDWLSEGRAEFGVGVSIFPAQYEIFKVPFERRGRICDEALAAIRSLWTSDRPEFHAQYVDFANVAFEPKPPAGRPRVWIGGDSDAALRRAARFGDGWMPWQVTMESLPQRVDALRAECERIGRSDGLPELWVPLAVLQVDDKHRPIDGDGRPTLPAEPAQILDRVAALAEAGVGTVSVPTPEVESLDAYLAWLEWFGGDVIGPWNTEARGY